MRRIAVILCLLAFAARGDDTIDTRNYDEEPALVLVTPEMRIKAIRELKRVEKRSKKYDIYLNRGRMEKLKGDRLLKVLASYDRFISILEELPEGFVKACRIGSVWFSDEIVDMDGNHAGGVAHGDGIELPLAFSKGTVYHEMFHKFECCIGPNDAREWEECNPDEFIYTGSKWAAFGDNTKQSKKARERYRKRLAAGKEKTAAEQKERNKSKKDKKREAANRTNDVVQAAFMGGYAQTTPLEDRACTFGAMMGMGPAFLKLAAKSVHLQKKMEWMLRMTGTKKLLGADFWQEHSGISRGMVITDYTAIPDAEWQTASPEEAGYDSARLALIPKAIKKYSLGTGAMIVVVGGKVLFSYGDVSRPADVSLCWPSLLSVLYGKYVYTRKINLDETLETLGVDDVGGLERRELTATLRNLLSSTSCCFHPAMGDPPQQNGRERGSVLPGGEFFYNNWDFNVAASIFTKKTEIDVFDAFDRDIAKPLRLQDWNARAQRKASDPSISDHPYCAMRLSARDMARIGELMLRKGKWRGMQIVPAEWVEASTRTVSRFARGGGFGYMWWIENENQEPRVFKGAFSARGLKGQRITVIPELDMVVAHLPEEGRDKPVKSSVYRKLLQLVLSAKK